MIDLVVSIPGVEDTAFVDAEIRAALNQQAGITIRMFQRTHRTWNTAVEWNSNIIAERNRHYALTISTDSDIYRWVTYGTGEHGRGFGSYIIPKGYSGLRLKYPRKYKTKTRRGVIGSKIGGKVFDGDNVYRHSVRHTGIKERGFVEELERRRSIPFQRAMLRALKSMAFRMFTGKGALAFRRTFASRSSFTFREG